MYLPKTLVVAAGSFIVGLALATLGNAYLGSAFAQHAASVSGGGPPVVQTLKVSAISREVSIVDDGVKGDSVGDMRVVKAQLFNPSTGKNIGRGDFTAIVSDLPNRPGEVGEYGEVTGTYTMPNGSISIQGLRTFGTFHNASRPGAVAITGGTGAYRSVKGSAVIVATSGTRFVTTFSITR